MAANTFIELNDVPSTYTSAASKFVRVNSSATGLQFWNVNLFDLEDVNAEGAYLPEGGQVLTWSSAAQQWRPASPDIYVAGNGLNKNSLTFNVTAAEGGGLVANTNGVYIADIANVSGTWGNATHHSVLTVNSKGQITGVSTVASTVTLAENLNASYVGNVVGTSGQITVTGGTGINSNATLNLVATGVTAGVYGNATHIPQITVDTYGRIQNIDLIAGAGGGDGLGSNAAVLTYRNIVVPGQTTLSADQYDDTLTLEAGGGFTITTNAATDTITFSADGNALIANVSVGSLSDVDTSGIQNGQVLIWNSTADTFEAANIYSSTGVIPGTYGNSTVTASVTVDEFGRVTGVTEYPIPQGDITAVIAGTGLTGGGTSGSVTLNLAQSGATPGTYGNATMVPSITVDALGRVTSVSHSSVASHIQSLSWNASTYRLSISGGNTVDLSVLAGGDGGNSSVASIEDLEDVGSLSGIENGQALLWNASNNQFEYGNVVSIGTANAFTTIAVSGQSSITASGEDTITLIAGDGVTIETNASAQSVTISSVVNQGLDFGTFTNPAGFTLDMGAF